VNGDTKATNSSCVIAVVIETFVGAVTPIFVETGMVMVTPMTVDTLAPTVWANACVDCACENCALLCVDDAKVTLGRAIYFKALPLLKCMHK